MFSHSETQVTQVIFHLFALVSLVLCQFPGNSMSLFWTLEALLKQARFIYSFPVFIRSELAVRYIFIFSLCSRKLLFACLVFLVTCACALSPPDDHSRVVMTQMDGNPCSDYVNASYIDVSECGKNTKFQSNFSLIPTFISGYFFCLFINKDS